MEWAWHTRSIGLLLLWRTSYQWSLTISPAWKGMRGQSTTCLSVNIVVLPYLIDFPSCHMRGMCTKKSQMELSWVLCQPFHFIWGQKLVQFAMKVTRQTKTWETTWRISMAITSIIVNGALSTITFLSYRYCWACHGESSFTFHEPPFDVVWVVL